MIGSQTLPALAFLAAISGLPGLKGLPMPATKEYARAKAEAAAADTLPPPWKPSWRLALENTFVTAALVPIGRPFGPIKLLAASDPRKLSVNVDPDSGVFISAVEVGDVTLGVAYRQRLDQFSREQSINTFREHWLDRSRRDVNSLGTATPVQRTGISVPIPVRLPGPVRTWLGPGSPALNVSGSESIRLSGTSNWTNQNLVLLGQRSSLFPSLDMQQDLDIRLEGQLSDRVKVNLLQNSANQVPLANRIAINYRGEEDDFIQALDLGNTSLSLPGTQYVSYSGKNEGLFGVKLASRVGPLDFTALASKQEGRSERAVYSGGGAAASRYPFKDLDWVKGQYFLLYDPNFGTVYDIDEKNIRLYLDDALTSTDKNVVPGKAVIDPGGAMGMQLPAGASAASVPGNFDLLNPGPDQQYEVLNNVYAFHDTLFKVIRLKQKIQPQSDYTLAVTYTATPLVGPGHALGTPVDVGGQHITTPGLPDTIVMKLLRVPYKFQASADGATYDTTADLAVVRELELKNFYDLGGFGIDPKSFKLTLQLGQNDPPITDMNGIPFIEMVGLDSWDEQTSQALPGHDGRVDTITFPSVPRGWVDYTNGVLFMPDPRPFAPRLSGLGAHAFDQFIDAHVNRGRHLDGPPDALNVPNPAAYELRTPQTKDAQWNFIAEFAATRSGGGDITLGRGNILENSEAVVVNGERWLRDRDYTIDYDLGRVTLKRQLGPQDQLSIDYSYAPLFAQASKTLIGSAFRAEGRDRSVGGAFLYQSQGAQDLRPRLGEEPSRTLITDLNTEWHFKPAFLTRLADALPGVRTTTPSEFNIQAEAGMSFPNPNTQNEVFVDDMEGVRDAVSLSLTPDRWRWSSVPSRAIVIADGNAVATQKFINLSRQKNAEVHWYTPINTRGNTTDNELVHERDLRPRLPDAQGAQNVRTVLAISMPRTPTLPADFAPGDTMWAGLTYNLDQVGIDLSRSQFIELWVDDWNDHHDPAFRDPRLRGDGTPGSSVKLHIDLGRVSEDQMRAPNRLPNAHTDTEDRGLHPDGQLTVTGDVSEDTGVDGIDDVLEKAAYNNGNGTLTLADLSTASPNDPEGDDWGTIIENYPSAVDPRRYLSINGSEGNHTTFPIPDTEDLNLNGQPDSTEAYFEYTIDLGDQSSPYLVTDVLRDFPGESVSDTTKNGWRRYRIPLTDSLRVRFGFPDLTIAQHVRLWLEGVRKPEPTSSNPAIVDRPLIMLGGLDIVGSRWQNADLTLRQRDTLHTTVTLNSVNTVDNADIYRAPFDPGTTRNGNQEYQRREQSIALEFTDLYASDTLEAFKTFSLPENYSRYGVLRWFASSFEVTKRDLAGNNLGSYDPAQDSLSYFIRFASDDKGQSYYELKRPLPRSSTPLNISWEEVLARIEQISQVKLNPDFVNLRDPIVYHTVLTNGDQLTIKGRPSFTRLLRVSFGVLNEDTTRAYRYSGQLWFDELRATDVAKDVGLANRVLMNGRWANLVDYNVAWNSRDADFLSVGETRGSGSHDTNLNVSTHFEPQRFFEGTGIQVPVTFSQNEFTSRPRFSAGDDIVRTGVLADQSETHSVSRSLGASYSRVWGDRSNPFLRYTLGGLNASINRNTSDANAPTSLSKSSSVSAGVTYQVALRQLLSLPLPFTKAQLFLLPERFYWNYGMSSTKSSTFTRSFGSDVLTQSSSQNGRAANVDFGADARPVDMLSYHVEGHRNLSLDGVRLDRIGFINLGRLTTWRQSFSSHMALNPNQWVRPSFNWSSNYGQVNDTQSPDLGSRAISNGQELGVNWDVPFDRLTGSSPAAVSHPPTKPDTSRGAAHPSHARRSPLPWRALLARFGALSTDGRIGRTSNYSRLGGTASPLYLIGLAENPGFGSGRIFPQAGSTSGSGIDWRTNARTSVPVAFGSSIAARFSYGDRTNNNNGVIARTRDWRFPDLEVQYGRVADLIGLAHILEGPQLRTAYARSYSVDYQNSRTVRGGTSRSDDWRPLFSVRGRFKNGTDADLRFERRSSVRESFQVGSSRQTDQTTNLNFSLSRSYTQGQKVNVLGRTSTVKTSVNLQLTTVYERQKGGIQIGNDPTLANPIDRTRMSVNGTGSYGFSTNVTGDLALGFSHFRETTGIVRRSIRVELRGQFRF
jgi:motility/secretion related protein SprA